MIVPAHLGIEHPSLVWLTIVGVAAFAAGLGIDLLRSVTGDTDRTAPTVDGGETR